MFFMVTCLDGWWYRHR